MNSLKNRGKDYLWLVLFLIVFLNGFEAGGYQASLWNIGKDYDLSLTSMGLYAAMELFATMLAPILLGRWADRVKKSHSIGLLLCVQMAATLIILFTHSGPLFLINVFFLGMTTSALQFIAIAAMADAYPVSGSRKIAYITTMYATGALVSPLVVDFYLGHGLDWRTLFGILAAGSVISLAGIKTAGSAPREVAAGNGFKSRQNGRLVLSGILLLSTIMCIYVGFENGFTFFVDTLFTDVLRSSAGKLALSLYWAVMIPSRILVGRFSGQVRKWLVASIVTIPVTMLFLSRTASPVAVLLLCIPLGFASGAIYPSVLTLMLPLAGTKTATATGIITAATGAGGVIFTALTGAVADHFGMRTAMLLLVSFFVPALLCALCAIRMSERLEHEQI